jgi:hypothetical protein
MVCRAGHDWFFDRRDDVMREEIKLDEFLDFVCAKLRRPNVLGDQSRVRELEQDGLYGVRVKLESGQIFTLRVGIEA